MIDLHAHTTFSDGTSTPEALLQEAQLAGLQALAITDHDTLAGFDAARPLAAQYQLELICGLELSTQVSATPDGRRSTVHLLGYFLDQTPPPSFRAWLNSISLTRHQRNLKLMACLQARNLAIEWADLPLPPASLSRTHFAHALVAKRLVPNHQSAFDLYLSDAVLDGIDRKLPSVGEGIEKIREASGLPSLAHPVRLPYRGSLALRSFLREISACGLDALEVYHSEHSVEATGEFLNLSREFDLLITGGSDYHGENKPDIRLGKGRGNLSLPYALLADMKKRAESRRVSRS